MNNNAIMYLRNVCAYHCIFANVYKTFDHKRLEGKPKCGVGLSPEEIEKKFDGDGCDKSAITVSGVHGVDPASQEWIKRNYDILVIPAIIAIAEGGDVQITREGNIIPMSKHLTNIGFRK